jgi:DSF synthase
MNALVEFPALANANLLSQIDVGYDEETKTLQWWMRPEPRPCFNAKFLEEVAEFEGRIEKHGGWFMHEGREVQIENAIFGSRTPGVFNLGGDLSMFVQAILRKDSRLLTHYGYLCVDNMLRRMDGFGAGVVTYSLVQGKAFGGGFECALSSEYIVAERGATFSFPEVLFNMFPGMGAISFLARRIGLRKAEEIVMSGRVFSAKEMYDAGVVDELTEDGAGFESAQLLIKSRQRRRNTFRAMSQAKRRFQPVTADEMKSIVDVWVGAAMKLETRDLRMMARLVKAQDRLMSSNEEETNAVDTIYEPMRAVA